MAMWSMGCENSKTDPCLIWERTQNRLSVWLSWIDDCPCVGHDMEVRKTRAELLRRFECNDIGEVEDYLGLKVERYRKKYR